MLLKFNRTLLIAFFAVVVSPVVWAQDDAESYVKIQTSKGDIVIKLAPEKAPKSVENFLGYVKEGQYDRTIFHRVIGGFVIQGGGYSQHFNERPTKDPVPYEGDNGLPNARGTIAMARTRDINSATNQWYINIRDNTNLDHIELQGLPRHGYTVFGHVVEGIEVVDAIGGVPTGSGGPFGRDVPIDPIIIERVDPVKWQADKKAVEPEPAAEEASTP